MGRDTKVGLFVGVVFIVLFGVILSVRAGTQAAGHADFAAGAGGDVRIIAPGPVRKVDLILARQVLEIPGREADLPTGQPPTAAVVGSTTESGQGGDDCDGMVAARAAPAAGLPGPAPVPTTPAAPAAQTYTVLENDSLSVISQKVYGTCRHWRKIFEANEHVLRNPDVLRVGQELIIPSLDHDRVADSPRPEPAPASEPPTPEPRRAPRPADPSPPEIDPARPESPYLLAGGRATQQQTVYVVQPGDNFYRIAQKVYGNSRLGYLLHMQNEELVPDPRRLQSGQRIRLLDGVPGVHAEGMVASR